MAPLRGFHHVALTVSDLDASIAWYESVLGLTTRFREPGDERRAAVLQFEDGRFAVGLVEFADSRDLPFDPHRQGLDHLAFSVDRLEDLHDWADRLGAAGVSHSGVVEIPPGAILNLKDPDGLALALFWDRP